MAKVLLFAPKGDHPEMVETLAAAGYNVCERTPKYFRSEPKSEMELDAAIAISDLPEIREAFAKYGRISGDFDADPAELLARLNAAPLSPLAPLAKLTMAPYSPAEEGGMFVHEFIAQEQAKIVQQVPVEPKATKDPMTMTKGELVVFLKEKGVRGLSGLNLPDLQNLIPKE